MATNMVKWDEHIQWTRLTWSRVLKSFRVMIACIATTSCLSCDSKSAQKGGSATGNEKSAVSPQKLPEHDSKQAKLRFRKQLVLRSKQGEAAGCIAFSPNGSVFATGHSDNKIRLWSTSTCNVTAVLAGHSGAVTTLAFNSDGKLLATAGGDSDIKLWNVAKQTLVATLKGHKDHVFSVAFSNNGTLIVSAGMDKTVRVWDLSNMKCKSIYRDHSGTVRCACFSPDDRYIASGSADGQIIVRDIRTDGKMSVAVMAHRSGVNDLIFTSDGKRLVSGGSIFDRTIKFWDISTGEHTHTATGHRHSIECLAFGRSGNLLASGSVDTTIIVWDMKALKYLTILEGHTETVSSVAFSPDGQTLASTSIHGGRIILWKILSDSGSK